MPIAVVKINNDMLILFMPSYYPSKYKIYSSAVAAAKGSVPPSIYASDDVVVISVSVSHSSYLKIRTPRTS